MCEYAAPKCRACGGDTVLSPVHADGWKEHTYRFFRCGSCGCDTSTLPYSPGHYDNDIQAKAYDWNYACRCVNTNVLILQRYGAAAGMTYLDYGTGDGAFMLRMMHLGLEVYGFEVSPKAIEVINGRLSLAADRLVTNPDALPIQQFDVVTAREVIEHVDDPNATMDRLVSLVKPGGLLQVQTPQAGEYAPIVYQWAHLCIFSVNQLAAMVSRRGCTILDHLTWPLGQCLTARKATT
jgi:SAM-dependent methyltransferase